MYKKQLMALCLMAAMNVINANAVSVRPVGVYAACVTDAIDQTYSSHEHGSHGKILSLENL